jgi:hypothetical protein
MHERTRDHQTRSADARAAMNTDASSRADLGGKIVPQGVRSLIRSWHTAIRNGESLKANAITASDVCFLRERKCTEDS